MSESTKRNVSFAEFEQVVKRLPGQQAWRTRAGSSAGSIFTMDFGSESVMKPLESEYSLMVFCAWRIVEGGRVLCTWHEDADISLAPALKVLEGALITNTVLTEWGDLTIDFQHGYSLQVWNDALFKDDDSWNIIQVGLGYFSVKTRNVFVYDPQTD